jgi:murein DD-endopeptidase
MRRISRAIASAALAIASIALLGVQGNPWELLTGFPAYVMMQSYHLPIVANVMGKTYAYYEIYVLNAYGADIDVRKLSVLGDGSTIVSYTGDQLAGLIRPLGRPQSVPSRKIAAAETAVFYLAVPFGSPQAVPQDLVDQLTFDVPQAGNHVFTVSQPGLRTNPRPPLVIAPPLRGSGWLAGSGPSNESAHRRTIFFLNGQTYLAQRFAIDWVEGKLTNATHLAFFRSDGKKNEDWYCYNQPLYAVADGVVAAVRNDLPDNVPMSPPVVRITRDTIGGNFVVLDLGYNRYAFYAHLRPHSATVHVGEHVKAGQIIGRLGHSGNSTGPHLHFHITDGPQFIFANGEPYAFATLHAASSTLNEDRPEDGATLTSPYVTYHNTMPGDAAIVDFGTP